MANLKNAPLIESIFELRWGEIKTNYYEFSIEEESLLPGIIATLAFQNKYVVSENLQKGQHNLPQQITNRFRKGENTWPCLQIGMGIFTVNQIAKDYTWTNFKNDIIQGLMFFRNETVLKNIKNIDSAQVVLRYQDAFYPDKNITVGDYISTHFHLTAELPASFYDNYIASKNFKKINMQFEVELDDNMGTAALMFSNAIINGKDGLLVDTSIIQSVNKISQNAKFSTDCISVWLEKAHDIQEHAFKTIIKASAYDE
ncbi:TIGR04255 family protein [Sulfurimonas sp. HSL-1716]|uniref:TIGR04255 family protein n=1 Tax=Hydrocurvibacter sulfurireducens TaxID=3131937 RepID=UPI0031F78F41